MNVAAVWVGKLTLLALRLIGRRGNALPGLVVEKLFPRYLPRAMATLPRGVVVVSGTNGKTTTTKMVATILGGSMRVLTNDSGSNFVRGAITTAVERSTWTGRLPYDVAVFELDEAWAVRFAAIVAPTHTLLLNVMRDQLDRFGEIDTTAKLLGQVAGGDDDRARAQPRRRAHRGARGRHPRRGQLLRRHRRAAPVLPERRGALRRPGVAARRCRPAPSCCACPARPTRRPACASATARCRSSCAPAARTTRRTRPGRRRWR